MRRPLLILPIIFLRRHSLMAPMGSVVVSKRSEFLGIPPCPAFLTKVSVPTIQSFCPHDPKLLSQRSKIIVLGRCPLASGVNAELHPGQMVIDHLGASGHRQQSDRLPSFKRHCWLDQPSLGGGRTSQDIRCPNHQSGQRPEPIALASRHSAFRLRHSANQAKRTSVMSAVENGGADPIIGARRSMNECATLGHART